MFFDDFLDCDITVHTTYGHTHRGVLKEICDPYLGFQVGIDILLIKIDSIYAITEHGIQRTDFADLT